MQGFGVATASYMYSLDYARTRVQGKHLLAGKQGDAKSVTIINHPDVKRQLLNMKAYVDGMRSLIYYYGKCSDIVATTEDENEKSNFAALIEVLTPIVKGLVSGRI